MCGRTSLFVPLSDLESRFGARFVADGGYEPRYNIAPRDPLEVVTNRAPDEIDQFRWGLVPQWADDPGSGLVNARSETAPEKPSFREAWAERPCLVLSSGFYEWKGSNGGPKQPYRVYRPDDEAFAMAGLWEVWESEEGESVSTVTILTTEPNDLLEPIHDRMPVVLRPDEEATWLSAGPEARRNLCRPYPDDDLDAYPVSTAVNSPTVDDARVVEPAESEQSGLDEFA